jgi:hypothetical protein
MKKTAILVLLTGLACLYAQEPPKPNAAFVTRFYQLKYADPNSLASLLQFSVRHATSNQQLHALTVDVNSDRIPEIEEMIRRFDVPPPVVKNVEVTIYLLSALGQPAAGGVPSELESVVKQLKSMFSYKGYQLIDTQVIRVRAGQGGDASGVIDSASKSEIKTISQIKFRSASPSTDEKGRAIRIDNLRVGLKVPVLSDGKVQYIDTGINTDVDIREGQKVVVGKANMDGSDRASIVVLTAKVVD